MVVLAVSVEDAFETQAFQVGHVFERIWLNTSKWITWKFLIFKSLII